MLFYLAWGSVILLIIVSVAMHELAHAWVAHRLGDPTAYKLGRITPNPLAHIDPFMTILLPILLLVLSGFRRPRVGSMWTALSGPLSNIAVALLLAALLNLYQLIRARLGQDVSLLDIVLGMAIVYNFFLAGLNLLPIPPLDGSKVLAGLLWFVSRRLSDLVASLEGYGLIFLFVVLVLAQPLLQGIFLVSLYASLFLGVEWSALEVLIG
jgi:Zn-dependent protease